MAAYIRQRPANWFWLVGIAITFWGSAGCLAWLAARIGLVFTAPPGWAFALAAGALLGGGIALLNKKLFAQALFLVALLAAASQILWQVVDTDMPPGQGILALIVLAVATLLVWFADYSRRHGWIS